MDLAYRPIARDELPGFLRTDAYGFGYRQEDVEEHQAWVEAELDRTVAAFEGDEPVGIARNYSLELTLPGDGVIPVAGVSWVSVRPTHRRRGVLSNMMRLLVDDAVDRGEPAAVLTASEGGIYGRFGFGVATRHVSVRLDRRAVQFRRPVTSGRLRLVEPDESLKICPGVFERVRRSRPGAILRPDTWWSGEWAPKDAVKHRFDVVYELDDRVAGFAVYGVEGDWVDGIARRTVEVRDLVAENPDAEAALWQYLCDIDLTDTVSSVRVPVDSELQWRITDPRQYRVTAYNDWLWLRPTDVPAYLGARSYSGTDRLVLDVRDDFLSATNGVFALDVSVDGVIVEPTTDPADLTLGVAELASVSLGGVPPSSLAWAGRIDATTDALARADRLFVAQRAPFSYTWF